MFRADRRIRPVILADRRIYIPLFTPLIEDDGGQVTARLCELLTKKFCKSCFIMTFNPCFENLDLHTLLDLPKVRLRTA